MTQVIHNFIIQNIFFKANVKVVYNTEILHSMSNAF